MSKGDLGAFGITVLDDGSAYEKLEVEVTCQDGSIAASARVQEDHLHRHGIVYVAHFPQGYITSGSARGLALALLQMAARADKNGQET